MSFGCKSILVSNMQFDGWNEEAAQREPDLPAGQDAEGRARPPGRGIYARLAALYAGSMGLYALVLAWHLGAVKPGY